MQKEFVTVTPDNGNPGGVNVSFTVPENTSYGKKKVEVNITSKQGNILKKVTVSQKESPAQIFAVGYTGADGLLIFNI